MSARSRRVVALVVGVVATVGITTALVMVVENAWPDDSSRNLGEARWVYWAALLALAHFAGGFGGGAVSALLSGGRPVRSVAWVCVIAFIAMSIPVLGAFDRPVEMASMLVLNLVTALGVLVGGRLIGARSWTSGRGA